MAIPKPSKRRPTINMAIWNPIERRAIPTIIMLHPITTPLRRPRISAVYGTMGMASMEPIDMAAVKSPRVGGSGWLKSV